MSPLIDTLVVCLGACRCERLRIGGVLEAGGFLALGVVMELAMLRRVVTDGVDRLLMISIAVLAASLIVLEEVRSEPRIASPMCLFDIFVEVFAAFRSDLAMRLSSMCGIDTGSAGGFLRAMRVCTTVSLMLNSSLSPSWKIASHSSSPSSSTLFEMSLP